MIKDEFGNARFSGVYRAIVVDNNDPLGKNRLRLQIPQLLGEEVTGWCWGIHQPDVFIHGPAIGEGVWVMFEGGDPSYPVWLGTFNKPSSPTNWGSFYDTTNHTIASPTTAYVLTFNNTDGGTGIQVVSDSKITVEDYGVYNIQFSAQVANTGNQIANANIWIRQNGVDVPASAGQLTVPGSHGRVDGQMVTAWSYLLEMQSKDYVEFWWQAESTSVLIESIPAGTTPTTPVDPSVAVTIMQVR